ncbi:hypothetical protein L6452_26657 [Arctium lappa]|uniref:Uncharacterized protein n=1 Tax=Arctium lappa TaxID=4217 RepID=A0ACB8ZZD2_ARCLA|nr:hypothetical protein L6452_26657 [Arctium lappa]
MSSTIYEASKLSSSTSKHTCHHFSLAEIRSATDDFDDELVIGKGGFGKVYKGRICIEETSLVVAIKRLDSMSDQGAPEFRAEIEILSKLRHRHLVSLIGFCDDNKEMILVYEFIPHGTLYHHLHKAETPLNWVQRLKIAIGSSSGLEFLHNGVGTQQGVIHRDIKSSNILLDENWTAMISDFGLSKIGPNDQSFSDVDMSVSVKGTFGYLDPEYFYTRRLTRKTDVFAFGVVLFELLSGRLAVDIRFGEEQVSLVRWARKCVKDRKLDQMVDSSIRGTIFPKCLRRFARIADRCLYSVPKERPSVTEVVASLQVLLELQETYDNSAVSSNKMGFAWKIHNYLVPTNKQISGSTSSHKSLENDMNQESVTRDLKKFTYGELQCATRNFGDESRLGDGRYAEVHKGWVDKATYSPSKDNTGLPIAIKRLHRYKNLDLEMLKEFHHPNLVKLLGYCSECEQLFLVYEFMPNGNLQDGLRSGKWSCSAMDTKVKIAVGIARALVFLHKIRDEVTVSEHRLQRHKILLDEEFTAKLSDYDITTFVDGDYTGEPSQLECNLSGFTVVFTEVLTGKQIANEKVFKKVDGLWLERLIAKKFTTMEKTYGSNAPFEVPHALFDRERGGKLQSVLAPAAAPLEPPPPPPSVRRIERPKRKISFAFCFMERS